jgi:hypothetical protein
MSLSDHELRALGSSLREIDPSALQSDPDDGSPRWFQGDHGTELFTWARFSGVDHVQLVFEHVSVEWSERGGLSTGRFTSTRATLGGRYDPYLMPATRGLDPELCRSALVLLEANPLAMEAAGPFVDALRRAVRGVIDDPGRIP